MTVASSSGLDGLRIREAVRGLVVDSDDRVLLVRFDFADRVVWALPGGGLDPGESDHDALRRELLEEVGLRNPDIGAHLWTRVHVFAFDNGLFDGQRERAYLVRVPSGFVPMPMFTWDELNAENLFEIRWWTLAELAAAVTGEPGTNPDGGAVVVTAPRALLALVADLLAAGPPATPPDIGQ